MNDIFYVIIILLLGLVSIIPLKLILVVIGIVCILGVICFYLNKLKKNKKLIETGKFWLIIGLIGLVLIIIILFCAPICIRNNKLKMVDILKIIGSYIAGVGVFFSYFYNKREERKIQVHSEANWRGRLFDLAKKEDLNYHDILYFMTFFNNHVDKETDKESCDFKLLQAIRIIVKEDNNSTDNSVTEKVYNLLYENKNVDNKDEDDVYKLLEKLCERDPNKSQSLLDSHQRAAFQLCIEFLLKADWNKQMNKEAGIKKSKNKKSKI